MTLKFCINFRLTRSISRKCVAVFHVSPYFISLFQSHLYTTFAITLKAEQIF